MQYLTHDTFSSLSASLTACFFIYSLPQFCQNYTILTQMKRLWFYTLSALSLLYLWHWRTDRRLVFASQWCEWRLASLWPFDPLIVTAGPTTEITLFYSFNHCFTSPSSSLNPSWITSFVFLFFFLLRGGIHVWTLQSFTEYLNTQYCMV